MLLFTLFTAKYLSFLSDDWEGLILHVDDGQPLAPLQPGPVLGDLLCLLLGHEPPPVGAQFRRSGFDHLWLAQSF